MNRLFYCKYNMSSYMLILIPFIWFSTGFHIIENQKINANVWSFSTLNIDEKTTNMNLVTYAHPISIKPSVKWILSLYKNTLTHENFQRNGWGFLQRLTTSHIQACDILGKQSGYNINKVDHLIQLGYSLKTLRSLDITNNICIQNEELLKSLLNPLSLYKNTLLFNDSPYIIYLQHNQKERNIDSIDVGDHNMFLCDQLINFSSDVIDHNSDNNILTTSILRSLKLL